MKDGLDAEFLGKGAHLPQGAETVASMVGLIGPTQGIVFS